MSELASDRKLVTVVHNANDHAEKLDAELKKIGFKSSFERDGRTVTFPTSPVRLYFIESSGSSVTDLRDHFMDVVGAIWEKLGIKSGKAEILVGDDWRTDVA
jgi:hypothetical protein